MSWLGLDIGGANLKASDGAEFALSRPFPLWKSPERLGDELRVLIAHGPAVERLAITMTGELCDCFATKSAGVNHILREVERAADGRHTRVYSMDGSWLSIAAACKNPKQVAASNWHALAKLAGRFLPGAMAGILIDVGSTTTDLIPIHSGGPLTNSQTDLERLLAGELVYSGVTRSPVNAVLSRVPYRDTFLRPAQELFATMLDVYLLLAELPEMAQDMDTADGKPATKIDARRRLARLLCAEEDEFHHRDAVRIAEAARQAQLEGIEEGLAKVLARLPCDDQEIICVTSGTGEFLARAVLRKNEKLREKAVVSLQDRLGARISACAPAYAVALLAKDMQVNQRP